MAVLILQALMNRTSGQSTRWNNSADNKTHSGPKTSLNISDESLMWERQMNYYSSTLNCTHTLPVWFPTILSGTRGQCHGHENPECFNYLLVLSFFFFLWLRNLCLTLMHSVWLVHTVLLGKNTAIVQSCVVSILVWLTKASVVAEGIYSRWWIRDKM